MNGCLMVRRIAQEDIVIIFSLHHLDGPEMPLETMLNQHGQYRWYRNQGEVDPEVDLSLGRHIVFHRE